MRATSFAKAIWTSQYAFSAVFTTSAVVQSVGWVSAFTNRAEKARPLRSAGRAFPPRARGRSVRGWRGLPPGSRLGQWTRRGSRPTRRPEARSRRLSARVARPHLLWVDVDPDDDCAGRGARGGKGQPHIARPGDRDSHGAFGRDRRA